jgi:hypothetical protein
MKGPIKADLWSYWGVADAICITTNGSCDRNGDAIMGRGNALEAAQRFPGLALRLGRQLRTVGNVTQVITGTPLLLLPNAVQTQIVALPTKPGDKRVTSLDELMLQFRNTTRVGTIAQGWKFLSPSELIISSLVGLVDLADTFKWENVVLPPPGAGNGGQDFNEVVEACQELLDDRFTMVTQ